MAEAIQKRRTGRYSADFEIEIEDGTHKVQGRMGDISLGGVLVKFDKELPKFQQEVRFQIKATPLGDIDGKAVLRWIRPGIGFGLEFSSVDDEVRLKIGDLICELAKDKWGDDDSWGSGNND